MIDPNTLEDSFQGFVKEIHKWLPDGIVEIDIEAMHRLGLLSTQQIEAKHSDAITHYFHVMETPEKITLFNEQFAIWIVPQAQAALPKTLTFISLLNSDQKPNLEIVFSTEGVYNTPKYIMKILQQYLTEVLDIEAVIASIGKKK